jgi:hypothetical protein
MAGTIVANTINTDTAGTVFTTNNAYSGISDAWVNFDGGRVNTAGTIYSSFNVSSVVRTAAGTYTVNFAIAMPNTNYAFVGGGEYYLVANAIMCVTANARTTSSITVNVNYQNTFTFDTDRVNVVIFSL